MSTQRPSYQREDTDIPLDNVSEEKPSHGSTTNTNGLSKDMGVGDGLPVYEGEDYAIRENEVAETAEDLVTRVIDLDDDTTLSVSVCPTIKNSY